MASVRKSVFGSDSERRLFKALESAWPNTVLFYHNLPLLQILTDDLLATPTLSKSEKEFVLRTSVDITACDRQDRPICCIEFDGLGNGYLSGERYVPGRDTNDPMRRKKLELKARLFSEAGLDFTVVGVEESRSLPGDESLTIAHGIVGAWLARNAAMAKMITDKPEDDTYINSFPPDSRWAAEAFIEDMANMDAMEEWNPLVRETTAAMARIAGLDPSFTIEELYPANAGSGADYELAEVTISGRAGRIVRRALMRRFGIGLYPYNLCMEAARLHASKAYLARLQAFEPKLKGPQGA